MSAAIVFKNVFKYYNDPTQLDHYNELILIDPEMAYWHAANIIKGEFKEGENAMAQSDFFSYCYSTRVLKGTFWGRVAYVFKKKGGL